MLQRLPRRSRIPSLPTPGTRAITTNSLDQGLPWYTYSLEKAGACDEATAFLEYLKRLASSVAYSILGIHPHFMRRVQIGSAVTMVSPDCRNSETTTQIRHGCACCQGRMRSGCERNILREGMEVSCCMKTGDREHKVCQEVCVENVCELKRWPWRSRPVRDPPLPALCK